MRFQILETESWRTECIIRFVLLSQSAQCDTLAANVHNSVPAISQECLGIATMSMANAIVQLDGWDSFAMKVSVSFFP